MNQVSKSQPAAHTCRVWGAAEGILLISWVNIPQSRLPLSLSLLLFQKTMCAETAPAPTMRPACKAASPSPACANRATPVSCARQVSTALGKKVGISSWEEMFFFFPAFYVKPSRLADDCERRLSQSMWESGSKLSLRLIWFANNFSSLRVTHRSSEPRWESSLDSGGFPQRRWRSCLPFWLICNEIWTRCRIKL